MQAKNAGINTLSTGFYQNPADVPRAGLVEWKSAFDSEWTKSLTTAKEDDFNLLLIGDDDGSTVRSLALRW